MADECACSGDVLLSLFCSIDGIYKPEAEKINKTNCDVILHARACAILIIYYQLFQVWFIFLNCGCGIMYMSWKEGLRQNMDGKWPSSSQWTHITSKANWSSFGEIISEQSSDIIKYHKYHIWYISSITSITSDIYQVSQVSHLISDHHLHCCPTDESKTDCTGCLWFRSGRLEFQPHSLGVGTLFQSPLFYIRIQDCLIFLVYIPLYATRAW